MPEGDLIDELMLHWEAARQKGLNPQPEELCAEHPQLIDVLRQRILAVRTMERVLGVHPNDPQATQPHGDRAGAPLPQIPGYEVVGVVDEGGMGVVYEARQRGLGRTVALKMISGKQLGPTQVARFRAEAEASARLQHPNFVQIFEVGEVDGRPFFSMEYVDGGTLAQYLSRTRPGPRQAAELVSTLAQAVHAAHAQGVIHRDLKPANILLQKDEGRRMKDESEQKRHPSDSSFILHPSSFVPKIADFGLAKRMYEDGGHTRTGEILGTPSYMAPEQAEGRKELVGPATDVYALGVVLYECLTGRPPFQGDNVLESLRRVTTEDPAPLSRLAPSTPPDLDAICLKCLEKAPAARYASARELAEDLGRFLNGQPVKARRIGRIRRAGKWARRHPQSVALAGIVALVTIGCLFYLINDYRAQWELRRKAEQEAVLVHEILHRNCFQCHGQDPADVKKNLNILDHRQLLNTERKIVVPGDPEHSRLIQRIADGSMPPEEKEEHLPRVTETELVILRDWILGGAPPLPPLDPDTPPVVPYSEIAAKAMGIFHKHCYECHKFNVAKGGIKILNYRLLVTVRQVVVPGKPEESELFQLITSKDDDIRMPSMGEDPLPPEAIATIRQWIEEGAPPFPKKK
jgi:serine/threonine protein kinase